MRISFPGRPIFIQFIPALDREVGERRDPHVALQLVQHEVGPGLLDDQLVGTGVGFGHGVKFVNKCEGFSPCQWQFVSRKKS